VPAFGGGYVEANGDEPFDELAEVLNEHALSTASNTAPTASPTLPNLFTVPLNKDAGPLKSAIVGQVCLVVWVSRLSTAREN
jgi:hypothetical protein